MRALLVVNPKATTTSERSRDVLVRALRSQVDVSVAYTRRRGHAATLAREATNDGVDVLVSLGGDGTVNEVVNGIMQARPATAGAGFAQAEPAHGARPATAGAGFAQAEPASGVRPVSSAEKRPALAVVPGGSTNVFARAVGMPNDWAEGTGVILEALRDGRSRTIGLGRANERYFTFCAGLGIDAEVVRRVERARLRGRRHTPTLYLRSTLLQYFFDTDRRTPAMTLERLDETPESGLATVIVQNTVPWTYLGDRPINPCPDASFETGLDLMALRELHVPSTTRTVGQLLSRRREPRGKRVLRLHDLAGFTLRAIRPIAFQLDGDYLGERDKVDFVAVPTALRVLC
jgi:diacylglycerol kinase family enzyme